MRKRAAVAVAAMSACLLAFSTEARGADDEEDLGFDIEEMSPEQRDQRDRLLRELTLPRSFVELGTYYQSADSYKYGDFTGLDQEGFDVLGNFDIRRRAPWESEETWNLRLRGYNLGLDSRSLRAEYGQQGLFDVWADFSQIPKFWSDDVESPYRGFGSRSLDLPPDWVAADSTAGFLTLDGDLRRHSIEHLRRDVGGGFSLALPWDLELEASYNRETKEGRKFTSAVIGSSGGNPRAAIVAEPVDYETQDVDALLRFDGERGQLQLGYYLSHFDDANESLTWQTAFLRPPGSGTWDPSASFPSGLGQQVHAPGQRLPSDPGLGGLQPALVEHARDGGRGLRLDAAGPILPSLHGESDPGGFHHPGPAASRLRREDRHHCGDRARRLAAAAQAAAERPVPLRRPGQRVSAQRVRLHPGRLSAPGHARQLDGASQPALQLPARGSQLRSGLRDLRAHRAGRGLPVPGDRAHFQRSAQDRRGHLHGAPHALPVPLVEPARGRRDLRPGRLGVRGEPALPRGHDAAAPGDARTRRALREQPGSPQVLLRRSEAQPRERERSR